MNPMNFTSRRASIALFAALGLTGNVYAHDIDGALGKAAGATDYYQVECFDDGNGAADHIVVSLKDLAPVAQPLLSVQVVKGKIAKNSTDAADGNATFAPTINVKGGNGFYTVLVDKTSSAPETYTLQIHCETGAGLHTGTREPDLLQNQ